MADRLAMGEFEKFEARRLAHEAETEGADFEETLKKLPAAKPGDKK